MTTIKDIAKKAGVSVTTVSKVINNYTDVSERTKAKVLSIMKAENYQPSAVARSLTTNRSYSIGVFFTDHLNTGLRHPFFREVIYGLEKTLSENGYDLIFFAHPKWGDSYSYVEKCKNRHVDGAILMGMFKTDPNLDNLISFDMPAVFVDLDIVGKNASYVISDNIQGASLAVQYLHQLGHEKIGMIMGQTITRPAQDRLVGFQSMINQFNLNYVAEWIIDGEFSEFGGYQSMKRILQLPEKPTGIFCHSDKMAIGAMKAIEEAGYQVPDDFSIIGFDDIEISRYVKPTLTTIQQDKYLLGQKAAEMLLKMITNPGKNYLPVILPTKLVVRDSCQSVNKK